MHTVPKPNFLQAPQLGQTVLPGNRASFFTACSADDMENDTKMYQTLDDEKNEMTCLVGFFYPVT